MRKLKTEQFLTVLCIEPYEEAHQTDVSRQSFVLWPPSCPPLLPPLVPPHYATGCLAGMDLLNHKKRYVKPFVLQQLDRNSHPKMSTFLLVPPGFACRERIPLHQALHLRLWRHRILHSSSKNSNIFVMLSPQPCLFHPQPCRPSPRPPLQAPPTSLLFRAQS